jgi:Cof subfamily protein (haloacid dehalogenase superfamily)
MNYRLIALDVDGTLLDDHHRLSEKTIQTLREVYQAGLHIVLCTGRGPGSAIPVLEELGFEGVLITHNGASTVKSPGPEVLHTIGFSMSELEELVLYCRANAIHFDVNTSLELFIERADEGVLDMYERFLITPKRVEDVLGLDGIVKLTMLGTGEQLDRMQQVIGTELMLPGTLHSIRSGVEFIDVISLASSKGFALQQLAASWGIQPEEIIAIGNYYNDLDMIRFAGLGIAMANSPDEVKTAADETTLSNNEDGVHEALVKHVLNPLAAEQNV